MDNDQIDEWWKAVVAACPDVSWKVLVNKPLTDRDSFFWEWQLDLTKNFTLENA